MQRVPRNLTILLFVALAATWWLISTRSKTEHAATPATVPATDQGIETLSPAMQQAVIDFQRRSHDLKTLDRIAVPIFDANPPTPTEIHSLLQTLHEKPVSLPTRDDSTARMPAEDARLRQQIKGPTQRELEALNQRLRYDPGNLEIGYKLSEILAEKEDSAAGARRLLEFFAQRSIAVDHLEQISVHVLADSVLFRAGGKRTNGEYVNVCVLATPDAAHALLDPRPGTMPIMPSILTVIDSPAQVMSIVRSHMRTVDDADAAELIVHDYLLFMFAIFGPVKGVMFDVQPHPKSDGFEVFGRAIPPAGQPGRLSVLFTFTNGKLTYVVEERGEAPNLSVTRTSY